MSTPPEPAGRSSRPNQRIIGIGFFAGLLNGLIAIGGGIIIVPGLIRHRGASAQVAVGTSLAAVVALSGLAFVTHVAASGLGQPPLALLSTIAGGIVGARLGAVLLARLSTQRMLLAFALFVFALAAKLIASALGFAAGDLGTQAGAAPAWAYPVIGCLSGIASGVFGVGGGALVILALAVFFGVPVGNVLTLALAINVTNALAGSIGHARAGRVLWPDVMRMLPAAVLGIAVGALLAVRLPGDMLSLLFGLFFAYNAALLMRRAMG